MFRLAWKNIVHNWIINIITCAQMSAAIVVSVIMVSSVLIKYQYYTPLKKYFTSKGIYCIFPTWATKGEQDNTQINLEDLLDDEKLRNCLPDVDEVLGCAFTFCISPDGIDINTLAYTDNLVQHFTPELASGRWLSNANDATKLEIVVSQNNYGWSVGDILTLEFMNDTSIVQYVFHIVGVLKENARIPGGYMNQDNINYMQFYQTYNSEIEDKPMVLMNLGVLKQLGDGNDIMRAMTASCIITYHTDIDDRVVESARKTLVSYGSAITYDLENMQEANRSYLYQQVYDQFPIIFILLILTCVSCISCSALTTRSRLKDYAIFYCCGLRWKQCMWINLLHAFICGVFSIGLSFMILNYIQFSKLSESYRVIWGAESLGGIFFIFALYIVCSMVMPYIIIGNNTPKQIMTR